VRARWALGALLFVGALGFTRVARGEPMPARDAARVLDKGRWRVGLLSPLQVGIGKGMEVDTQIVPWFLLSPNASLRVKLGELSPGITATGEYGLSVPTMGMRMLQGYLFPTWMNSSERVGFFVVPSAGLMISGGTRGVWTGRLETAAGIPLGRNDATPLETYAPIELLFAPALNGFRARLGGAYDHAIFDWLRAKAALDLYMIGASPYPPRSPLYLSAALGVEVGLGRHVRVALGGVWYNYDQRAQVIEKGDDGRLHRVGVRSNDVYPTLDLIIQSR